MVSLGIVSPECPDRALNAMGMPLWCTKNWNLGFLIEPRATPVNMLVTLSANLTWRLLLIITPRCDIKAYPSQRRLTQSWPCLNCLSIQLE